MPDDAWWSFTRIPHELPISETRLHELKLVRVAARMANDPSDMQASCTL